ncbi:MAG: YncE family protein [Thermoleophilia bacterium]|nr:YncE family protein [Thermoleophilia bacterium]
MEPLPPSDPEPFMQQESRRARSVRRAQRRWRVVAGVLFAVVFFGAVAYAVYGLMTRDGPAAVETNTSASSTIAGDTTLFANPSTSLAATGGSATSASNVVATTTTSAKRANLPPQELTITGNPEFIKLAITLQDGTILNGKTPFTEQVPGGDIHIEFTKGGYNGTSRDLILDKPTVFKVWLDREGQLYESLVRFKCGPNPKQVAFTPDNEEMWVSLLGGYGLEVYDPTTGAKLDGVQLGEHGAVEVIFTRDGRTAYASQMETATVYEIDRATRTIKRRLDTGGVWTKVVLLSPDEKTLWASNWVSNNVSEIDLATGELVRLIPTVVTPRGLHVTPDAKSLYVAGYENGDIQKIDLGTGKATVLFKTGGAMRHMVADVARGFLYVDDMSTNEVYVVNLGTDKITKLADTDQRPNTMDLSPDGRVLYVSNRGKDNPESYYVPGPEWGTVLALDTATGNILDAIVGGNQCTGLDVSPDGSLLAFSNFLDNHIEVFRIPDYETLLTGDGGRAERRLEDRVKD